jgi:hypothetical protein
MRKTMLEPSAEGMKRLTTSMKDVGLAPHEIEMMRAVFRRIPAIVEVVL